MYKLTLFFTLVFITLNAVSETSENIPASRNHTAVASSAPCLNCHQEVIDKWLQSDHAKSMADANSVSILANFNNVKVEHYGQKAFFHKKDEKHFVTISYDSEEETYLIKYSFGHYPLQQYLVETKNGKLQVLPFAWDSRPTNEGGQRWYHNYEQEEIKPNDRLHWKQPLQNWNGMCADCHSDGLKRNYELKDNSFNTHFDGINVGCSSCHGKQHSHIEDMQSKIDDLPRGASNPLIGNWLRNIGESTAHWQGKKRDNTFMDKCFACHSLRVPLNDGIDPDKKFLDQFSPQFIHTPLYFPDGQIKEEVYVYGSFLQSKMYGAGVNCLDCHDKHTMKVKIKGNGLCLQCHNGDVFESTKHHGHIPNSKGAMCVNCHMPERRYMGVDDRRDHSFVIPRPHLAENINSPNACMNCHKSKDNNWASKGLIKLHGRPPITSPTLKSYMMLQMGSLISIEKHLAIIADVNLDIMKRATALNAIYIHGVQLPAEPLIRYISSEEPLLRLALASVLNVINSKQQTQFTPLLDDELKAVRVAAANALLSNQSLMNHTSFVSALKELKSVQDISNWRGEGLMNRASTAYALGNWKGVEKSYQKAIKIDPYFAEAYVNLSEFYRQTRREVLSEEILELGLETVSKSGVINYAYGLMLVRNKRYTESIKYFEKSVKYSPDNPQYLYMFALALDTIKQTDRASIILNKSIVNFPFNKQLRELAEYIENKIN